MARRTHKWMLLAKRAQNNKTILPYLLFANSDKVFAMDGVRASVRECVCVWIALHAVHEVIQKPTWNNYQITFHAQCMELNKYLHFYSVVSAHDRNVKFPYELFYWFIWKRLANNRLHMNQLHTHTHTHREREHLHRSSSPPPSSAFTHRTQAISFYPICWCRCGNPTALIRKQRCNTNDETNQNDAQ